jgi:hypothetical protein
METELPPWPKDQWMTAVDDGMGHCTRYFNADATTELVAALRARLALAIRNLEGLADGIPLAASHPHMVNMRKLISTLKEPS